MAKREELDPISALDSLWEIVGTFSLTWWIYWLVFEISGEQISEAVKVRRYNDSAPLIALFFGILITLASLLLFRWRLRKTADESRLARVPRLWFNIQLNSDVGRFWRWLTITMGLVLPIAFQVYFWQRFQTRQAWPFTWSKTQRPQQVELWKHVTPWWHLFAGANDFRYGRLDNWNIDSASASFTPLWEPLFLAVLSAANLIVLFLIVKGLIAPPRVQSVQHQPQRRHRGI
jgi:hypothetical protein